MGEKCDAKVLQWKEEVEKEKACTNATVCEQAKAKPIPCSTTSMEVEDIEQSASCKPEQPCKI